MTKRPDIPLAAFVGERPRLDRVRRILLVRLRSIGDTVLMTPCITALKRWRPDVEVDVLLEPFCAPLLEPHPDVRRVVVADRALASRARTGFELRKQRYDLAINLNGGTTASLLALASGAPVRVGFAGYRYPWLANCRVTSSHDVWRRTDVHTVEHQLALAAGIGIPVEGAGPTSLAVDGASRLALDARLAAAGVGALPYAVLHPEASLATKRWPAENFAHLARALVARYALRPIVIGQDPVLVARAAGDEGVALAGIPLGETIALLERAAVFVGNDSGPAHVAAAFARPVVVIFGPSSIPLWRPWSQGPWRIVRGGGTAGDASGEQVLGAVEEVFASADRLSVDGQSGNSVLGASGLSCPHHRPPATGH